MESEKQYSKEELIEISDSNYHYMVSLLLKEEERIYGKLKMSKGDSFSIMADMNLRLGGHLLLWVKRNLNEEDFVRALDLLVEQLKKKES